MALSRWSHSAHYIYEVDAGVLQVCLFGNFTVSEILNNYKPINERAKNEGYTFLERLELKLYLKSWALFMTNEIDSQRYIKILKRLRLYGKIMYYAKSPWSYKEIPKELQIAPCFSMALKERS